MKLLKETVRRLILENQNHFDKLMDMIGSEKIEYINQVFELALALGYIEHYEYRIEKGPIDNVLHVWAVSKGYSPDFLQALFLKNRFLSKTNIGNHEDGTSFDFVLSEGPSGRF